MAGATWCWGNCEEISHISHASKVMLKILQASHQQHTNCELHALIYEPNIPGFCANLLFTASDFTSITSHIHNWVFLLWFHVFILSGVISPLISSSILGTTDLGSSSFSVLSFCLFILCTGFSRQEYWSGLPFPSPVDHILSLWPVCLVWPYTTYSMAHSFIELDKAVVNVINLINFLWLWFSLCLPSDR